MRASEKLEHGRPLCSPSECEHKIQYQKRITGRQAPGLGRRAGLHARHRAASHTTQGSEKIQEFLTPS